MAGVRRERADQMIRDMIAEADAINADPEMTHWVVRITVFGSYLTDKAMLGDLDISYVLKARWRDRHEMEALSARVARRYPMPESVRKVFFNRLFWPETVIRRRLNVGRGISFHNETELEILECPTRLIYEHEPSEVAAEAVLGR